MKDVEIRRGAFRERRQGRTKSENLDPFPSFWGGFGGCAHLRQYLVVVRSRVSRNSTGSQASNDG